LNVVMSANPIGLIVIAIAALVAGVILAYQHFKVFHDIVDGAWQVLQSVVSWITDHWQVFAVALLGPIGLVLTQLDRFKQIVQDIIGALERVKDVASTAFGWLGKVGGFVGKLNPFAATGTAAATGTPAVVYVNVAPGDDFPERVYEALRTYQHRHARPQLVGLF
jgi:di/tricarboxylate transporter